MHKNVTTSNVEAEVAAGRLPAAKPNGKPPITPVPNWLVNDLTGEIDIPRTPLSEVEYRKSVWEKRAANGDLAPGSEWAKKITYSSKDLEAAKQIKRARPSLSGKEEAFDENPKAAIPSIVDKGVRFCCGCKRHVDAGEMKPMRDPQIPTGFVDRCESCRAAGTAQPKTILFLFEHSGVTSKPWRDAGYRVVTVDIQDGNDVLSIDADWLKGLGRVEGVFAMPPCTDFAVSGARWFAGKDADGRTKKSVRLVKKTLAIIRYLKPKWWAIENPVGRIASLVPALGKPTMYFDPADYAQLADNPSGEQYTKRTALWGKFVHPTAAPLPAVLGSKMHRLPPSEDRADLRSITPSGFARAFFTANKAATAYRVGVPHVTMSDAERKRILASHKPQGETLPPQAPASATINPIAVNLSRLVAVKALPAPKATPPKEPTANRVPTWEKLVDHVLDQASVVSNLDYAVAASKETREVLAQSTLSGAQEAHDYYNQHGYFPKAAKPEQIGGKVVSFEDAVAWRQAEQQGLALVELMKSWQQAELKLAA